MKKIVAMSLLAGGLAFAQTGLMGGADGIHQQTAGTLGQGGFSIGTGGDLALDAWSLSRGGQISKAGDKGSFTEWAGSLTGNLNAAYGVVDFMDVGLSLPLYYDHANTRGIKKGAGDLWKASRGDLDIWAKFKTPVDEMTDGMLGIAGMVDFYIPTGDKSVGVRPRHAWYLNNEGKSTHPFTLNEMAFGLTLIMTADFQKMGIPLRWNGHLGMVLTTDHGTNTLVYGTGVNVMPIDWMDAFLEFSGEFRVEKGVYPRDPLYDPMLLTPGLRFHLPMNVDFAIGLDVGIRALTNFTWKYSKEMHSAGSFQLRYGDKHGNRIKYGYTPTPRYAGTASLSWRFGNTKNDEDKDGVANEIDQCANTPSGAVVDSVGCPIDSDKDGVFDGIDQCPGTTEGAAVDSVGCSIDNDADGVVDSLDKCPNTPAGTKVGADGCPADSDNDGVADDADKCPNTPKGAKVDGQGCPVDTDKDGIADYLDKCPNTPKGISVDNNGCPLDYDQDGVPDYLDKCPNTQAGLPVDANGCSPDADKDGVPDALDKCPNTPANAGVDAQGCPLDTDKDGVPDYLDKCPNTLQGVKINKDGCPLKKAEDLERLKKGIQFKTGSSKLTKSSYKTLNSIAKLMKKIKSANLEVQGHTDSTGSAEVNKKLSEARAQTVVKYLIKKGIKKDRLRAVGFGPDKPIADNSTKKGRKMNRRVELIPFEK